MKYIRISSRHKLRRPNASRAKPHERRSKRLSESSDRRSKWRFQEFIGIVSLNPLCHYARGLQTLQPQGHTVYSSTLRQLASPPLC
ncbi:hypothetical protein CEXT_360881 [Caerostris extrusa]|uniref:Uncharacterized protein n=1 Tax=Caerostris extrusa TaxID=172846 RepID=A0AAV4TYD3_CAEEX|nr:hypothetical protein CEXT_360881 [Caerostris extrusa]